MASQEAQGSLSFLHQFTQKLLFPSFFALPDFASVMAPHSSKMKSSVKPNASRSELSTASASSIVLVLPSASSQIWDAVKIFAVKGDLEQETTHRAQHRWFPWSSRAGCWCFPPPLSAHCPPSNHHDASLRIIRFNKGFYVFTTDKTFSLVKKNDSTSSTCPVPLDLSRSVCLPVP